MRTRERKKKLSLWLAGLLCDNPVLVVCCCFSLSSEAINSICVDMIDEPVNIRRFSPHRLFKSVRGDKQIKKERERQKRRSVSMKERIRNHREGINKAATQPFPRKHNS